MIARELSRQRRHRRVRKRVTGIPERPRMAIFRSHKHLYIQVINDMAGKTLFSCSTQAEALEKQVKSGGNVSAAEHLGRFVAAEAKKRGVNQVVFDRGGYRYHGRIKALAEAARKAGLQF